MLRSVECRRIGRVYGRHGVGWAIAAPVPPTAAASLAAAKPRRKRSYRLCRHGAFAWCLWCQPLLWLRTEPWAAILAIVVLVLLAWIGSTAAHLFLLGGS